MMHTMDWISAKDGDPEIAERYRRHYSAIRYRDAGKRRLRRVVGPGEYAIWRNADFSTIAIFRRSRPHANGQSGIYLSAFIRNNSLRKASEELTELVDLAFARWPDDERIFTYVDPRRVRTKTPGYSFIRAGWRKAGETKNGLLIFERRRRRPKAVIP